MYYENNIVSLLNLLKCVDKFNIKHFVFSSSCSVYGNAQNLPVTEETPLAPSESPYATTKQMGEQILTDLSKISSVNIVLLRYFNPVGAHLSGLNGEVPIGKPNNLVPVITQTAAGLLPMMHVWGGDYDTRDGSCIRDYIHVMDLADGHVSMIKNNRLNKGLKIYNFGTGKGLSVLEVIKAFEKQTGIIVPYKFTKRREGDAAISFCSPKKALKELNWKAKFNLNQSMIDIKKTIKL
jgi:UDP-glucose 4-epimerase